MQTIADDCVELQRVTVGAVGAKPYNAIGRKMRGDRSVKRPISVCGRQNAGNRRFLQRHAGCSRTPRAGDDSVYTATARSGFRRAERCAQDTYRFQLHIPVTIFFLWCGPRNASSAFSSSQALAGTGHSHGSPAVFTKPGDFRKRGKFSNRLNARIAAGA